MGILTKVTLQCCPAFDICSFESPAKLDEVVNNLQDKVYSADHYRFWWFPYTGTKEKKIDQRLCGLFFYSLSLLEILQMMHGNGEVFEQSLTLIAVIPVNF